MNKWVKPGAIVVAIVLAVVVGAGTYAMTRGDDGEKTTAEQRDLDDAGNDVAGICLEGDEDCVDTFDGAAGESCLEGDTGCVDESGGAAGSSCLAGSADCGEGIGDGQPLADPAARCLPEYPECDDTGAATGGGLGMCAPGVTDCVDVAIDPSGGCTPEECGVPCKEIDNGDGTISCAPLFECTNPAPADDAPVNDPDEPVSTEPGQSAPGAPEESDAAPPSEDCVAPEPCAVPDDVTSEEAEAIARRCEEMQGGSSSNSGSDVASQ